LWSSPGRRPVLTLAGQFLLLQLAVLLAVLGVASVVSLRQSEADFREQRGVLLRRGAEHLANTGVVRRQIREDPVPQSLVFQAETERRHVDATIVLLAGPDGRVLVATDPEAVGDRVDLAGSTVQQGRAWTGDVQAGGQRSVAVHVPVLDNRGRLIGIVVVAGEYPTLREWAAQALPDLVTFLGLGLALGMAGSWLLSRLIRRRTRGLEPAEIASLADQREAVLHSIREGVVAVNSDGVVSVLSDSARELLDLPLDSEGRRVADLALSSEVRDALTGPTDTRDEPLVVGGRVLVLNRSRVEYAGRQVGTVTTLRDRTELLALQSELSARESVTETLRAQTHEFHNQLHTISGLVQLGEFEEVSGFVSRLTRRRAEISDAVTHRIDDPAVAALLIAKVSVAGERGLALTLTDDTGLPRLDPELSGDVGTVLGNLVDNAVDATVAAGGDRVDVRLVTEGDGVVVQVVDTGAGVPAEDTAEIFRRGWSTKPSDASGRGVGLALVQLVAERRGGQVSVHNDRGAVFTVRLPGRRGQPGTGGGA
jgi:two-component system CitB family sensor kinase